MRILGQTVVPGETLRHSRWRWKLGDFVAVSGLRRHDGTVVASLIERRRRGQVRVAGFPYKAADETIRIGAQVIAGLDPALLDRRILVSGRLSGTTLVAGTAAADLLSLMAQRPSRLSIEDYVAGDMQSLDLASGLPVADGASLTNEAVEARAFVSARVEPDGQIHVESLQFVSDPARTGGLSRPSEPGFGHRRNPPGMRPSSPKDGGLGPDPSFDNRGQGPTGPLGGPGPNGSAGRRFNGPSGPGVSGPGGPPGAGPAGGPPGGRRP
ncbi:hypothetical protein M8523_11005 [Hyphomicrobiales bacterium BP6-180914]|uniref:DUF5666 domain-containing protein n=2 Tax=Lichenifustis flavocetrariae TaxID=2949735 RepID=A0AA41YWI8_9HYPH|nr:hypothetical protein [Lichenifustis flavocetrariae]MCW6508546.1 hypothetical protein [Lichenifustis flavocetrariae]